MDRESLAQLLDRGVSVERIAQRFGKHPSTVAYWMGRYGLVAPNREKHAPKGALGRKRLEELVAVDASIATMAEVLQRSPTTVRHWLAKYGLETQRTARLKASRAAKDAGVAVIELVCRHHGKTAFAIEWRGAYRCLLCRSGAVLSRRRKVKAILVQEAGGACVLCGYNRCVAALHFHHRDPEDKAFGVSGLGVARSIDRARAEARKCVLLCSNCHAEVENGAVILPEQGLGKVLAESSDDTDTL
ncbi:MAG: helix-turn-helix domain-containing protein [Solirubrobacteraceae bacterium]